MIQYAGETDHLRERVRSLEAAIATLREEIKNRDILIGAALGAKELVATERDRLRSEVDSLKRDAERLDWIEAHGYSVRRRDYERKNLILWQNSTIRIEVDAALSQREWEKC